MLKAGYVQEIWMILCRDVVEAGLLVLVVDGYLVMGYKKKEMWRKCFLVSWSLKLSALDHDC